MLSFTILFAIAAWLFRDHLSGVSTFLGNPDRLNANLKILKFYVDNLANTGLQAWNEAEMLGYDSFAQPGVFPNPFTYLIAAAGPENVYISAGYFSFLLLAAAGFAAYCYIRSLTGKIDVSLVAAVLYQCSALSILKVSQNDMTFAVVVILPLIALVIHRANTQRLPQTFLYSSVLTFVLLQFCFLQKAAYAILFAGAYAAFQAWSLRSWKLLAVFSAAACTGIIGAAPRLYGVGSAVSEYVRVQPEVKILTFSDLFRYQGIKPYQILRWFEDGIFGRYFSDGTALLNGLNLSEGFLLYSSALVPAIVIVAMTERRGVWNGSAIGTPNAPRFFLWMLIFTFAVALSKPFNYVLHILFLKMDFVHARFLMVGLLVMVAYLGLYLSRLRPLDGRLGWPVWAAAGFLALAVVVGVEFASDSVSGHWKPSKYISVNTDKAAAVRAILSVLVALVLLLACRWSRARATAPVAFATLCISLALQAVIGADFRMNGSHTRGDVAFPKGDIYWADRSEFRPPSSALRNLLHHRIERDQYRSVVICDASSAGGLCVGHIGQFWQLRLADGYYGIGVPARLAMLPWPNGLGLRHIRFTFDDKLPWPLLGLLNVKYALVNDNFLYRNQGTSDDAASLKTVTNPASVTPRAFFAAQVIPAQSVQHARTLTFVEGKIPDVQQVTIVEGFENYRKFSTKGAIRYFSHGDRFDVVVEPSPEARFLVVNELYTPRWKVTIDGRPASLHPANVVMRGVVVPAGASRIEFRFTPTVRTAVASVIIVFAAILLIAGAIFLARLGRHYRVNTAP